MKCPACGGVSKVLERRGLRRRRECQECGHRWTTLESLLGVKPVSLPPALAKLGRQGKKSKHVNVAIRRIRREIDTEIETDDDIRPYLPEIHDDQ